MRALAYRLPRGGLLAPAPAASSRPAPPAAAPECPAGRRTWRSKPQSRARRCTSQLRSAADERDAAAHRRAHGGIKACFAHVYSVDEIDMTKVAALRAKSRTSSKSATKPS